MTATLRTLAWHALTPACWGVVLAALTTTGPALARSWMSPESMRADFAGQTLDGHYGNGTAWTETYAADGKIDYRESARAATGRWYFRDATFCTFYDPSYRPAFVGGCWQVLKTSANCYEFYTARNMAERPDEEDDETAQGPVRWNARGWRKSEPSTCLERPSV